MRGRNDYLKIDELRRKGKLPLVLRGRRFTYRGLRRIIQCIADHYGEGRTRISEIICIKLNWKQPNGWLKDRACRDVLRQLAKQRLIRLPRKLTRTKKSASQIVNRKSFLPSYVDHAVEQMPKSIEFELAKGNSSERLWNELVEKYHYLGHKPQVGRCLKYLIRGDGRIIGAISFASPAWRLAARDSLLTRIGMNTLKSHDLVINNSRFLILPAVRVAHLASRILALSTRRVLADWSWFYSIQPLLVETFVEPQRFNGTSYRAANWIMIGGTAGFAKVGAAHHNSQRPKMIFLYGLTRSVRRKLSEAISGQRH